MDLQKALNQILSDIQARKDAQDKRENDLSAKGSQLELDLAALAQAQKDVASREAAVLPIEDVAAAQQANSDRQAALDSQANDLADQIVVLKQKENDLVSANAAIKQREDAVLAREQACTEREANYLQALKDEFFKQVSQNLPQ